jgi:hypothetical protein
MRCSQLDGCRNFGRSDIQREAKEMCTDSINFDGAEYPPHKICCKLKNA